MSKPTDCDGARLEEGPKEALRTFSEQTKILITLASGFVLAPPAVLSFLRKPDGKVAPVMPWTQFAWAEGLLVLSILAGYVVLSTIAGAQHQGVYNVHRTATRVFSGLQICSYLSGVILFLSMIPVLL